MLALVSAHWMDALQGILMVLGGFSILAKITPTPKDDKIIDKVLSLIHSLGLTKKAP